MCGILQFLCVGVCGYRLAVVVSVEGNGKANAHVWAGLFMCAIAVIVKVVLRRN